MKTLLALLLLTFSITAETISGKVVSVSDGDTVTILDSSNKQYKIRFEHIDTPEKSQDFGQRAKQHLSKLIFGKQVKAVIKTKDRYSRYIATIYLNDTNINLAMVKAGFAWHYKAYSKDKTFAQAEEAARTKKLGLWADKSAVPPWDHRRSKTSKKPITDKQEAGALTHWVSTNSGVRHNSLCTWFKRSKGKLTDKSGGKKACGICGG